MLLAWLSVLVLIVGVLIYAFARNPKIGYLGLGLYIAGVTVTLDRINRTEKVGPGAGAQHAEKK